MKDVKAVITLEEAKISCNFEQVEQEIQDALAEYKGAVFTEDSKTYAKKHVASLRAKKKELQDHLRDGKKKYMEPWDKFEAQVKKLIAMYDEPIDLINGQVQGFEEKRIAEKNALIRQIYTEVVSEELAVYISFDRIFDRRWQNVSVKEKEIRREIKEISERTRKDIDTISGMESNAVPEALSRYCADLDLTRAVSYINTYERQKQEILDKEQDRRRREEEERIRREERERIAAKQQAKEEREAAERKAELERQEAIRKAEEEKAAAVAQAREEAAQEVIDSLIPDAEGDTELYEYRVSVSADAKEKLEMYMDSIGIEWEMI